MKNLAPLCYDQCLFGCPGVCGKNLNIGLWSYVTQAVKFCVMITSSELCFYFEGHIDDGQVKCVFPSEVWCNKVKTICDCYIQWENHIPNAFTDLGTVWGAGIACWLEHRTHAWKVANSNPGRSGGRIFFSRDNFVRWLLIGVRFTPVLSQWHVKDPVILPKVQVAGYT